MCLDVGPRKENFERAMAADDPMAAVYAVTEEEMKRARAMIDSQVCLGPSWSPPQSGQFN